MNLREVRVGFLLLSVFLVATGFCDLDAEFMSQRFSEFWRSVGYWELTPFWKLDWWSSYALSLCRIVVGVFILGWLSRGFLTTEKA